MEWGYAKKFVIVLLILLNICLLGLNYRQSRETAMTASQERAVFEVLSENGITMYTDLILEYEPMSRLACAVPTYTKEELERMFFQGERTTVVPGAEQTVYRGADAALTISGYHGSLRYPGVATGKGELQRGAALETAEQYLAQLQGAFSDFVADHTSETEEGFCVTFYEQYRDRMIFSNYIAIYVSESGVYQVTFSYCPVIGPNGDEKDIFYSDEALLTFLREWKKSNLGETATISRMELGYDMTEKDSASEQEICYAVPCYYVYLMEREEPVRINAYTCQMVEPLVSDAASVQ